MKNRVLIRLILLLATLTTLTPSFAYEDRSFKDNHRSSFPNHNPFRTKHVKKNFRYDNRYRHDRSYPRRGFSINRLPLPRPPIHFRNHDYFFQRGIWYRPSGSHFTVVIPPFGIVVPTLPPFYTTLWVGNIPYYYANDVYYTWQANRNGYVVAEPPRELIEQKPELIADELFIYPISGQSEQQQADDRYDCHRWSVSQTNYDPTLRPGNISASNLSRKREDYQRAMRACLEGRNYSVR
ncbi:MAG: hypothetical protein KAH20_16300 [Methylococcales bacterium]|nr:hypothetical protein [Methylococcales bacterium]